MKAFFAFDRTHDSSRADLLRGRWDGPDRSSGGFCDEFTWSAVQMRGPEGVAEWVRSEMEGADVVVVLIGAETGMVRHVRVAIEEAGARGLGLVGLRIHRIPDANGLESMPGSDPLAAMRERVTTHDWLPGFSDRFLPDWIYLAAERAGRA